MNKCKSCDASKNRESLSTSGECNCLNGFYDDGTNEACLECPVGCKSC